MPLGKPLLGIPKYTASCARKKKQSERGSRLQIQKRTLTGAVQTGLCTSSSHSGNEGRENRWRGAHEGFWGKSPDAQAARRALARPHAHRKRAKKICRKSLSSLEGSEKTHDSGGYKERDSKGAKRPWFI